jgi:hypothetical protein
MARKAAAGVKKTQDYYESGFYNQVLYILCWTWDSPFGTRNHIILRIGRCCMTALFDT